MGREPEVISVTDLRNSTREVVENAHFRNRRYVVERAGQPMVVVLGVEEYHHLVAEKEDSGRDTDSPRFTSWERAESECRG